MTANQYQQVIDKYVKEYGITVIGYYIKSHGSAWIKQKQIKIPKPTNEFNFYICLHEVGHIACGICDHKPTWIHEYEATKFALDEADKLGITFSKELMESIKGYLRWRLFKSIRKRSVIDTIPAKVFKLAGINKYHWKKKIEEDRRPVVPQDINTFLDWRTIKVTWIENKRIA